MEQKSQVDDNISSSDRISNGVASSSDGNKVSTQSQRDTDVSTISSERVQSVQQNSIRSEVSSETGEPLNNDKKLPVADRTEEVSQGVFTAKVPCHHERLKTDSFSSKDSGEAVRLSSVDSANPQLYQCSTDKLAEKSFIWQRTTSGYSNSTPSNESTHVRQSNSSNADAKVKPTTGRERHRGQCKFDLNEGMEAHVAEPPYQSLYELNSGVHVSKPVPVVAKVGVPVGLPKKPLEFSGELGWRRYANVSAFRPTLFGKFVREMGGSGIVNENCPRRLFVSQGFDLNVAATMESELPADETSMDVVGPKQPEKFLLNLNCRSGNNEVLSKHGALGFDLNDNPAIEDMHKTIFRPGEIQQLPRNCVSETATCSVGSGSKYITDCRTPYWADVSSARGLNHIPQRLLVAAPTAEQVQMMIPFQSDNSLLPQAPSGFYIGKINNLSPPFYPPNVLPRLYNQHGAAVVSPLSGPLLAAYPGTVHVLENLQGINPTAYANVRPTFIQNDGITILENQSRAGSNADFFVPARSTLFEGRMKPIERVAFPASHPKRRVPDGGWESSQGTPRQMAQWN